MHPTISSCLASSICNTHYSSLATLDVPVCACNVQVDSPAQLANILVSVTDNSEEIKSEDVSLTVGLLDTVSTSLEDLQQEDVSPWQWSYAWTQWTTITANPLPCIVKYHVGASGRSFHCE